MNDYTKGKLEITEGIKIYIVPIEVDEVVCEIPYDYAKDFNKTEKELLANAERLVKCWNCHDKLEAVCEELANIFPESSMSELDAADFKDRAHRIWVAAQQAKAALAEVKKE